MKLKVIIQCLAHFLLTLKKNFYRKKNQQKHIALRGVCIQLLADQTIKRPNKYELHCIIICTASFYFIIIFVFITSVNVHCLNGKKSACEQNSTKKKTMSSFSEMQKIKKYGEGKAWIRLTLSQFMNKTFFYLC